MQLLNVLDNNFSVMSGWCHLFASVYLTMLSQCVFINDTLLDTSGIEYPRIIGRSTTRPSVRFPLTAGGSKEDGHIMK